LLGQQQLFGNAAIAGREIMDGLRASGHRMLRADHILKRHAGAGHIVVTGKRRCRRYRLTTDRIDRFQKLHGASSLPSRNRRQTHKKTVCFAELDCGGRI